MSTKMLERKLQNNPNHLFRSPTTVFVYFCGWIEETIIFYYSRRTKKD